MHAPMQTETADRFRRAEMELAVGVPDAAPRSGPAPEPPRLVERKTRRRNWPHGAERELAIRYHCPERRRPRERRLGLAASQRDQARTLLRLFELKQDAKRLGIVSPRKITVDQVVAWCIEELMPDANATRRERDRYADKLRCMRYVATILGKRRLDELTPGIIRLYLDTRTSQKVGNWGGRPDAPNVSRATAARELVQFRIGLKRFRHAHNLNWIPDIVVPREASRRLRFLTQAEFEDLLMACRGHVKDPTTGHWVTETVLDPTGAEATRLYRREPHVIERRRIVERFIILGVFNGSRHEILLGFCWRHHPRRPCIDVDAEAVHRNGYGEDPDTGKPRTSSGLRPELLPHLRAWREEDRRRGIMHVIHKPDGTPYRDTLGYLFNQVVADAGLGPDVTPHVLRHTAVTWMLMDGYDVVTTADLVGMKPETVWKYRQWTLSGHKEIVRRHTPLRRTWEIVPYDTDDVPRRAKLYMPPVPATGNRRRAERCLPRPIRRPTGQTAGHRPHRVIR